jgi:nitroreductase
MTQSEFATVQQVIRSRRTEKVMARERPVVYDAVALSEYDARLAECVRDAGWAPFHRHRGVDGLAEPWRVHWLRNRRCRELAAAIPTLIADLKPENRLASLLGGCGSLLLVTWLPESESAGGDPDKRRTRNEEHLAATAAFVQNVLLLATAAGFGSFWSSGTLLRQPAVFAHLGLAPTESLLAALFIDYAPHDPDRSVDTAAGGLRNDRSGWDRWCQVHE